MRIYRIYWIKSDGHLERGPAINCHDDDEAIAALKELKLDTLEVELREGARLVARYPDE
ncbi:MAG: hypothetical protein Q8M88_12395 [Phenylobacterium sp.]|uniref:hypothetical protein n=1 Tax=Phenylobacterium sp. TaxID=1871053 RepID=UPI0027360F41|nr:hypothetical protein [Phenylobacterium sp.]MDP3175222.1 hypothetical protein [Phenylobacterium sp.]